MTSQPVWWGIASLLRMYVTLRFEALADPVSQCRVRLSLLGNFQCESPDPGPLGRFAEQQGAVRVMLTFIWINKFWHPRVELAPFLAFRANLAPSNTPIGKTCSWVRLTEGSA